ncbi:uncharacterized protein RAG0_11945 [Rhynchosporium agropyri]|uniref:Uncharacterized protein n=2 Tax=Rhynchosporium TaxID=38037 RepID=A0A1E1L6I5_9HELO|nr:uncharacterized protein RCO7_06499 [Rhynchosporium commune]CZT06120.1 uncharacterized protein RAG0_11945 [Rhynchosporium agropyri]
MNPQYPHEKSSMPEKGSAQHSIPDILAPAYTPFRTSFASLSLHRSDRIRLLSFPQSEIDGLRNVIQVTYAKGLQAEQKYGGSHEFKLYGNPWYGQSSDAIASRVIIREILSYLFSVGWILHATTDVSKKQLDKDTLFFRKQQTPPPPSEWISISFNRFDRLRLIGADEQLRYAMKNLLSGMMLLQEDCGWKDQRLNAWEFKIKGYPWMASGEETMSTRLLLMRMLECLEGSGWSLYASVDQNTGSGNDTTETDSWYCVRGLGWVPGSAVFHR